jgi:L-asparaginase II
MSLLQDARSGAQSGHYAAAVEVTRGPIVESIHAAAVAVADAAGGVTARLGSIDHIVYMRSAIKPFQAMAVIESGAAEAFSLTPEEIAVICGSHSGEPQHVETVARILSKAGLGPEALRCGTHIPFSPRVAAEVRRTGRAPTSLEHNCSGKHAGMLAAAAAGGHDTASYLEPSHPVQQKAIGVIADLTGRMRDRIVVGVDGCGAPALGITLSEAARAFARLAGPDALPPHHRDAARRVVAAMRSHPLMVAGTGMSDSEMTAHPRHGLIAKRGAEGVQCLAFVKDGTARGAAAKVGDGNNVRARIALTCEILRQMDLMTSSEMDALSETSVLSIRNDGGRVVGGVRGAFKLV